MEESPLTRSERQQLQDADTIERWADDGGMQNTTPEWSTHTDTAAHYQCHPWKPQRRAWSGKSAPALTKQTSDVAHVLARVLKR